MNPGERKSGTSAVFSVSDVIDEETDKLLQQVNEGSDFGKRKQVLLKALVCHIHSCQSHIILFIAISSSHLDMMGIHAC